MDKLVLIDGHAILHRAFHAYPELTTSKGELINAVYGFTSILLTVLRELGPKYVAVTFDLPKPTFRHKKFEGYKAKRPEVAKELIDQIGRVHQVVETLNIPIFEVEGYEADDVIGTLARQAVLSKSLRSPAQKFFSSNRTRTSKDVKYSQNRDAVNTKKENFWQTPRDLEVIIVTGDRDALQLVDNNTKVYLPARGKKPAEIIDRKKFIKKYLFEPEQLVDLKALAGDPSDDIPGVCGIGPKTATDLILKFGGLKAIYKNLDKVQDSTRSKLVKDKDSAFMSYDLARIETKVPIKLDLKKCRLSDYDKDKALKLFEELEFKSLIKRLPDDSWSASAKASADKEEMVRSLDAKEKKVEKVEKVDSKQMGLF